MSFDLLKRVPVHKVGFGPYRRSKKVRVGVTSNLKENYRQHKEFLQAVVDNAMTDRPLDLKNLLDCQLKPFFLCLIYDFTFSEHVQF